MSKSTIGSVGQLLLSRVGNILLQSPTVPLLSYALVNPLEIVTLIISYTTVLNLESLMFCKT